MVLQFRRALKPFTSSARRDQLTLKHWERAHAEFVDYPFAKFNRRVRASPTGFCRQLHRSTSSLGSAGGHCAVH